MDPRDPFMPRYAQTQSSLRFPNRELPPFRDQNYHNLYHNNAHLEHNSSPSLTPLGPSPIPFRNHHQTYPDPHINRRGIEINSSLLGFDRNIDRSNVFLGPGSRVFDHRKPENKTQFRLGGNSDLQRWDSNFIAENRPDWDSNRVQRVSNVDGYLDRGHEFRGDGGNRRFYEEEMYRPRDFVGRKRFRENENCVEIDDRDHGFSSISGNRGFSIESRGFWDGSESKPEIGYREKKDNDQFDSLLGERDNSLAYVPGFPSTRYGLELDDVKERKTWFGSAAPSKQQKVGEEGENDRKWTRAPREGAFLQQSLAFTSYAAQESEFADPLRRDRAYDLRVMEDLHVKATTVKDHPGLPPISKMGTGKGKGKGKKIVNAIVADGVPTTSKKQTKRTRTLVVVPTGNSKSIGKTSEGHRSSSATQDLRAHLDSKCVSTPSRGPLVFSDHRMEKSSVESAIGYSPKDNSKSIGKTSEGHQSSYATQDLRAHLDSKCVNTPSRGPLVFLDHRMEKSSIESAIGYSPKDRPVDLDVSFKSDALVAKEIVARPSPLIKKKIVPSSPLTKKKTVPSSPLTKKKIAPSSPMLDCDKTETKKKKKKKKKKIKGSSADLPSLHIMGVQESQEPNLHGCSSSIDFDASSQKGNKQLEVLEIAGTSDNMVIDDFGSRSSPDGLIPLKTSAMGSEEVIASQDRSDAENSRNVGTISIEDFAKNKEISISDAQVSSLEGRVGDQHGASPLWTNSDYYHDSLNSNDEKCDNASLSQSKSDDKATCSSLNVQYSVSQIKSPSKAMDLETLKANFDIEGRERSPVVPETDPPESSMVPELQLNSELTLCHPSGKTDCTDTEQDGSFTDYNLLTDSLDPKLKPEDVKLEQKMLTDHAIPYRKSQLLSQATKQKATDLNVTGREKVNSKTQKSPGAHSLFPQHAIFPSQPLNKFKTKTLTRFPTPRTWRRTDGTSPSLGQNPIPKGALLGKGSVKKLENPQNSSYIRKGNSLVRKSTSVTAPPRASLGNDSIKNVGLGVNPPIERPKTPSLPETTKSPNFTTNSPQNSPYATTTYPPENTAVSTCPTGFSSKVSIVENQGVDLLAGYSETHAMLCEKSLKVSESKQMVYVKPKSNQLIAAPRPIFHDSSSQITEMTLLPSDGYCKRRKNQIVRNVAALDSQINQSVVTPDDGSNSEGQIVPKVSTQRLRSFSKRKHGKVLTRTCKPSKLSLVWTLGGAQSHNEDVPSLQHMKILPSLFPWKRAIYRRCFTRNMMPLVKKSSFSPLRKLQLSRKRDTIYTRSGNGFSLRKSGVFSIGGSNLKWSKSIERHSKKASEEATLAVAAVERKKREQNKAKSGSTTRKSALGIELHPGERIFRIGSVRYKMDPSKRTLLRIPDGKSSHPADHQSGDRIRTSFVPKRLLIGNDEYIRIGNGNQLVRDPKQLVRILASEKVRWSLHTARLRLAKKQQFCQFFTRFGKCNKDGGKCPYIHDTEKVAVCTKFLKGSCTNVNCRLTHKVIPERMQDCSYFLQGLCANENCPYRHVNVDPNASVCEGFLKGYCADGDECCKKHSYVCPQFEATGICRQGSKCKLHHPKKKDKCGKRSRHKGPKNSRGRYFVSSSHLVVEKSSSLVSDRHTGEQSGDIFCSAGRFADYISLDVDEESRDSVDDANMMDTSICESDPSDSQSEDLDALIKPIRLMRMSPT